MVRYLRFLGAKAGIWDMRAVVVERLSLITSIQCCLYSMDLKENSMGYFFSFV